MKYEGRMEAKSSERHRRVDLCRCVHLVDAFIAQDSSMEQRGGERKRAIAREVFIREEEEEEKNNDGYIAVVLSVSWIS